MLSLCRWRYYTNQQMFIYLCLEKKQFFIYLNLYGGKIEENAVQSFVPVGQLYAWKWEGKMK